MAHFNSLQEAQEFFKKDTFATGNGMVVDEIGEESCVCSMKISDQHKNALGGVMGGAIFSLGDFAFAVTVNHVHMPSVAQQVNINFLAPPKGDTLIARTHVKRSGRTSTIVNIDVTDNTGRDVAQLTGTGYKL